MVTERAGFSAAVEQNLSEEVLEIPALDDEEIATLLAFLSALSSPDLRTLPQAIPDKVPSGLPLVLPYAGLGGDEDQGELAPP